MGSTNPFNNSNRILHFTLYALLALLIVYLYLLSLTPFPANLLHFNTIITYHYHSYVSSSHPPSTSSLEKEKAYDYENSSCDYSNGDWIQDMRGPLYNVTICGTIKETEKCIINGRPDMGYLYWRWKPNQCHLPRFEPNTFLELVKNKHVSFIGDSLARNQLESLLCMLATNSTPNLVYQNGEDKKFRRWHFPSHNATFSLYWSPFLVQGIERSNEGKYYNTMYLDHVNERWANDIDKMDLIVVSFGHWFLIPSIYYEGDSVLGSLNCHEFNYTQIDFYVPLRKALRTTLNSIIEGKVGKGKGIDVIVKTFSPDHFEGEWDKAGTCSKTKPYRKGEKKVEGMEGEIRRIETEEVEIAKRKANEFGGIRFEVLDVTELSLLRPDGHPGPYMNSFPFSNGVPEHVQNDCVH